MTKEDIKETTEEVEVKEEDVPEVVDWESVAKRARADYENLKRESDQKIIEIGSYATIRTIESLLDAFDNLRSAVSTAPDNGDCKSWIEGISHINRQLETALKDLGVERINPLGKQFNPDLHEAMSRQADEKAKTDDILEVLQEGYILNDRAIRPAKVVLAE